MTATPTLTRVACPRCGWSPGEFAPGARIDCTGNHPGRQRHRTLRCVTVNALPTATEKETQ